MILAQIDPPAYVDFVDLCSVANISVMIFNEELNGYYIHGKSPSGSADVSSEKLRLNLIAESMGNSTCRGIHSSMPDAQTFQIIMPVNMIEDYKKYFLTPVKTSINNSVIEAEKNFTGAQKKFNSIPAIPQNAKVSDLEAVKELMNKIMKKYID